MKKLWRFTGWGLIFLGALHTVVFVGTGIETYAEILNAGVVDALGLSTARMLAWYGGLWFGVMMMLFGVFAQSWIKTTKKALPRYIGWTFAALGLLGIILQPVSGAPLVLLWSMIIVFARP